MSTPTLPGTAPVKAECVCNEFIHCIMLINLFSRYLLSPQPRAGPDDDAAEGSTKINQDPRDSRDPESSGAQRSKKFSKEEKKNKRGANKGRRFQRVRDEVELCWKVASGRNC